MPSHALVDFGFFSMNRKEKAILQGILDHADAASRAVEAFVGGVEKVGAGDSAGADELLKGVFENETAADTIHRELSLKVAQGAFFGGVREDILNLLEKIDDVADDAKDAARFLSSGFQLGAEARAIIASEDMKAFTGDLRSSVQALKELIQAFEKGKAEVLEKVHAVEEYEEWADTRKDALIKQLFASGKSLDPVTVIQLRDFIFISDNIADDAEDASDVILVLVAKGYG